LAKTHKKATAR